MDFDDVTLLRNEIDHEYTTDIDFKKEISNRKSLDLKSIFNFIAISFEVNKLHYLNNTNVQH